MILFFGDLHGKFGHVERAVAEHRPDAIILLGDVEAQRPLEQELANVLDKTEVWFIHGNHDTDSEANCRNLFESSLAHRNLHGQVVTIAGVRVAGLGGIFRGEVWLPQSLDDEASYASYQDYQARIATGQNFGAQANHAKLQGKLLKHRSTIFPDVFFGLAAQEADVLVTHEAPSCHPHGFAAIDELARCMQVGKSFHAHHHDNLGYRPQWSKLKFEAYGVGLRGITALDGSSIRPGELDEKRAGRLKTYEDTNSE